MNRLVVGISVFAMTVSRASAAVTLHGLFVDHAVLQRDADVPVWGTADAGERVSVALNGRTATAVADAAGTWRVTLPPMPAGGPFELTATATNVVRAGDVMLGDVWLCGGQSNMEWRLAGRDRWRGDPLPKEADGLPMVRQFAVERKTAYTPAAAVGGHWARCSAKTIDGFSGVAYYFARDLHADTGVAVGLIVSAWGGTLAEAWTSEDALRPMADFAPALARVRKEAAEAATAPPFEARLAEWIAQNDPGSGKVAPWSDTAVDTADWRPMTLPGTWPETDGLGVVWLRRSVDVPADAAGRPAVLSLGRVDDADTAFVNGTPVGSTYGWEADRRYAVPAGVLTAGRNTIAVRVLNDDGPGGVVGPASKMTLTPEGLPSLPIDGEWLGRVSVSLKAAPPLPLRGGAPNTPTVLYNGMIAPLRPYAIKGVLWYQGESNSGRAKQYETLFPALIDDWRNQWRSPRLPFLYVQIAPFKAMGPAIREAQRRVLAKTTATAMTVTTHAGDADDIHPRNKAPVGAGLALAARALAFGQAVEYAGPLFEAARVERDRIVVTFTHAGNGLVARSGPLRGFEVAGADGKFVKADAAIEGDAVVVRADAVQTPTAVRFGWANVPNVNLFNAAGLPASPFRSDGK